MIVIKINISFGMFLKSLFFFLFILANYFSINQEDQITNQSYIETSRITACKNIHLTFSSKVSHASTEINLILFTYRSNTWNKTWEYMHKNSHWGLHQLSLNISETNEDIRVSFSRVFFSTSHVISFNQIVDISVPISTHFLFIRSHLS